jgi:MYXO-CTERM domain-containing protein
VRALVFGAVIVLAMSACASGDGGPDPEPVGTAASAITAADAIARAEEWVTAKLLYCQAPNGASDTIDPACPPVCMRMSNPAWDPYRSDCSGLVSWAWGLPAPGRTTSMFAPNQSDITSVIQASALQMGDAVNTDDSASSEHHIMLFKAWTIAGQEATFIEEPGCSANPNYAHEFTSAVTLNGSSIKVAYNGISFTAIRYAALGSSSSSSSGAPPPPTCQVKGVDGVCIDTSVCATMPGYVSTPGYCPGPASEQCCTPTSSVSTSSSSSSSTSSSSSAGATDASSSSASSTGGATTSSSSSSGEPHGSGGAPTTNASGGHGASGTNGTVAANNGCASSPAAPAPAGGLVLLVGLVLARRKKRVP